MRASERLTCATASKSCRRLDGGARAERGPADAVDAERAQVVARVVVRGQVPAARVDDQAERAQLAPRLLSREGACRRSGAVAAGGSRPRGSSTVSPATGAPSVAEAVKPSVASSASTWRRSVAGRTRWILARAPSTGSASLSSTLAARRHQPEHDDDRLGVGQHQRRQPVARPDAVAAADAALALDGDPELLQRGHVAADRPAVDPEQLGDLRAR